MKKILFTDLYGTLINSNKSMTNKIYNSQEKEFNIICNYLNQFLQDGNYIVIVTSPGGHGNFGKVFNKTISEINRRIEKQLQSHITYYMQGNGKISEYDNITKKYINGKTYFIGNHNFYGIHVNEKVEAITEFLSNIKMPYQLYAIGDSHLDIEMLLKIQKFGGKSAIIDHNFYIEDQESLNKIIQNELQAEFHFEFNEIMKKFTLEQHKNGSFYNDEQIIEYLARKEKRKQELYNLFLDNKIDLENLRKNYFRFIIYKNYIEQFKCNRRFNQQDYENIMNMSYYPTFANYYIKTLKKR